MTTSSSRTTSRMLRRYFGPSPQAPECCIECGERLIDTEHPTRRFCDGRWRTRAYRARLASRRTMPMSSIITNVILPGLGPVCPEYFSRGHIPAFRLAPGEVYSYGIGEPQAPTGLGRRRGPSTDPSPGGMDG